MVTLILSLVMIINILLSAVFLFFERRDIGYTWAWLMIFYFIPILGFIVYLFLGRNLKKKNFYGLSAEERNSLKLIVENQLVTLKEQRKENNPLLMKYADLIQLNLTSSNAILTNDNEIFIFDDGQEKFDSLFADIKEAKKEINIQYYIIQPDSLGKKLRDELTIKAKEGVKVRVLYDEIGSKKLSLKFFRELISAGGEVEVFFPSLIRPLNFRMNNRNHRKLCIIDGEIAYIGGFNLGNEYLGMDKKFGYWRDTHFKMHGDAVNHIQGRFILDWKHASKSDQVSYEQYSFNTARLDGSSPVQIVSSGPNSQVEHLKNMYIKLIVNAKKSVYIQTPYFIPDSTFMDACKIALLSGVDLRIMIPNKPDHPFVYWATWAYAGELLDYGAKILLYDNGFLHAKTIVVDEEVASVGTMNIDSRSFRLNFEVNAIVYDERVAKQLQELFHQDSQLSTELTSDRYRNRSLIIKFKEGISRLLSPIL
ncbi:cardiolipin synthase [Paenibacillus sp. FSL K6-1122]|uniref:Cardiolipin synthase n=1 Tax=Paenibacillus amylolyticus TaxID=1451 RepID=A0ABD8AKD8_PAEAM|nr:cardiolipin synthase [Paenibacillus amylolyticus]WFA86923.1 cardiolipin synthase [Paenibacillus amylolyticus]